VISILKLSERKEYEIKILNLESEFLGKYKWNHSM